MNLRNACKTFFLVNFFLFDGSERRADFHSQGDDAWVSVKVPESVFHVLRQQVLPTPIFTIIFSQEPQNEREVFRFVYYDRKSILRKWVYSFKHSGNSRGAHRGPEIVSPDRRSGLKMGDSGDRLIFGSNFLRNVG